MGLNDRNNDSQTFGSTWTVETNVSSNPEDLSSRGIGLQGKFCMYLYCAISVALKNMNNR